MASEEQVDSGSWSVTPVPSHLLDFLRSQIVYYVSRAKNFSAEVHQKVGQPARLVFCHGAESAKEQNEEKQQPKSETVSDKTNKILVRNVPPAADEDILEVFFESKKKRGGGPVQSVQLNREKRWAIVEFYEQDGVEVVMNKLPITMMDNELDIQPYILLIDGGNTIESLDIRGLPNGFTEDLLTMYIEGESETSSAEYKSEDGVLGQTAKKVKQSITTLKPVHLRMLAATWFSGGSAGNFPNVKIDIDHRKNEIVFEGDDFEVQSVKLDLYETLGTLSVITDNDTPEDHIELFKSKAVIKYVNNQLTAKKLICEWEVNGQSLVICGDMTNVNQCHNIIRDSVKERTFPICNECAAVFFSTQWQEELQSLQKESKVLCRVFSAESTTTCSLVAVASWSITVENMVTNFLHQQIKIEKEVFSNATDLGSKFEDLYKLNRKVAHAMLENIAEKLSLYHVAIEFKKRNHSDYTYTIKGTAEGRLRAKQAIERL